MDHTLLVADDSVILRTIIEITFERPNFTVVQAEDGLLACHLIYVYKPDIVIADINMPERDGYQVCRFTKSIWPQIPVLLLVGILEPFDVIRYKLSGANGVLEKPFDSLELFAMVETLIAGRPLEKSVVLHSPRSSGRKRELAQLEVRTSFGLTKATLEKPSAVVRKSDDRPRVFLCHASSDKDPVRNLYSKLAGEGFQPWLDEEDILPGQDWDFAIRRALRESHAILVCLSKAAITRAGYLQKEIAYSLDLLAEQPEGSIFLIPVQLEDCEIPGRLKHLQVGKLFTQKGLEQLIGALAERARELRLKS
jgi:DNA-binding response OmpR family regulator